MRVRAYPRPNARGGLLEILESPSVTLPPLLNLDELFELEVFQTSTTDVLPFHDVEVEWSIKPLNGTSFDDYKFTLTSNGAALGVESIGIGSNGTLVFTPYTETTLRIHAVRLSDKSTGTFSKEIFIDINVDGCWQPFITANQLDEAIIELGTNKLSGFSGSGLSIRRRKKVIPSPEYPNQFTTFDMDIEPHWKPLSIEYYFPLELVLDGFFNADLDLYLEFQIKVIHEEQKTDWDLSVDISANIKFDAVESALSIGVADKVAEAVNNMLPYILCCPKTDIDREATLIMNEKITEMEGVAPEGSRLFDIRIMDIGLGFFWCFDPKK